jgi:hypothetical protein
MFRCAVQQAIIRYWTEGVTTTSATTETSVLFIASILNSSEASININNYGEFWKEVRYLLSLPGMAPAPASCTMGNGSFPGVKSGRGVTLTPHLLLVPWSSRSGAISVLPLQAIRPAQSLSACTRVHFTSIFTLLWFIGNIDPVVVICAPCSSGLFIDVSEELMFYSQALRGTQERVKEEMAQ